MSDTNSCLPAVMGRRFERRGWPGALVLAMIALFGAGAMSALAGESTSADTAPAALQRQYTYAWMFSDADTMKPRGGTTRGPAVELATEAVAAFTALQEGGLPRKERDRRAILALVGDYRTSFDFIETVGLSPGYTPTQPYQSWGTERVYLVQESEDFISLQHIIVMHFAQDDGGVSEPMVVKHWRQDWRYEDAQLHAFQGRKRWTREVLPEDAVAGSWTQTVYQVDDSPRYEAIGRWVHAPGMSSWESADMRRPLPRREFSVRDDYHALYGSHRITVYPGGWTQEEDALKLVLDENNEPASDLPYLAREAGLSRYQRVQNYDFSAGDEYWAATGEFWAGVRDYWDEVYASRDSFSLGSSPDEVPLFMALFQAAEEGGEAARYRETIDAIMARYLKP